MAHEAFIQKLMTTSGCQPCPSTATGNTCSRYFALQIASVLFVFLHSRRGSSHRAHRVCFTGNLGVSRTPFQPVCGSIQLPAAHPLTRPAQCLTALCSFFFFLQPSFQSPHKPPRNMLHNSGSSVCAHLPVSRTVQHRMARRHVTHDAVWEFSQHLSAGFSLISSEVSVFELHATL